MAYRVSKILVRNRMRNTEFRRLFGGRKERKI